MTADYNGWNDAPEAEREAMDDYSRQEFEREALAQLEERQKFARQLRKSPASMRCRVPGHTGTSGRQPETSYAAVSHQAHWRVSWSECPSRPPCG